MDRPHQDDKSVPTTQHSTSTIDIESSDPETIHTAAPVLGKSADIQATLEVVPPPHPDLHMEEGEQSVLVINMVNGNIDLQFKNSNIPSLVDTGATVSCMREGLASTLSKLVPHEFLRIRSKVYLADGALCHIKKAIKIKFKIQGKTFNHQFAILPNCSSPIILGTDFLSKTKSKINYSTDPTPKYQPIRAVRAISIPPFSEMAITGQVTCYHSVNQINGITDNFDRSDRLPNYIVQRSVVTPDQKNRHPLILLNITSRICKIQKGEIVALYTKTDIDKENHILSTGYDDTQPEETDIDIDIDNNSTISDSALSTGSDKTFYVPTPTYSECSDSDMDQSMSDDDIINTVQDITGHDEQDIDKDMYIGKDMDIEIEKEKSHVFQKPDCLTEEQYISFCNLIEEYDDIFVGKDNMIGRTHLYTHKINLIPDAKPLQFYPFRMAPHKAERLEIECQKLVKQDILEETKTGPWSSRSFLVEKKNGQGYRLVTDLRYVNSQSINQALTSPRADDSLEMIGEMRPAVFSKMDAQQGYFQIPIREDDRDITAFLTRTKKYRYKTMPMGLASSAQAFQAVVNLILQNLQYKCAIPYLDDILCLSPSIDQHFIDLRNIFEALRNGKLKLKKTKCEFFLEELDFLGMKVTTDGIKPSPDKVHKIQTFPTPKTTKEVRSFTGLAQFYRKFIKGFSEIGRPLFNLLKNGNKFVWTKECDTAFQTLKDSICNDVILLYPDYKKQFHLTTDASGTALGATLSQEKDGVLRPVAFAGRALHDHERNYGATQRELLGVVFAIEYFRHYLEGRPFELYTDHQALIHMLTKSDNKNMWARWALKIQQFQFNIRHIKGKLNIPSDVMSRRDYPLDKTPMTDPPPKPKAIRVQHRIMFEEDIHTQKFQKEEPPSTLPKLLPKPILKRNSTHHYYCECMEENTEDIEEVKRFTPNLRANPDIPSTKLHHFGLPQTEHKGLLAAIVTSVQQEVDLAARPVPGHAPLQLTVPSTSLEALSSFIEETQTEQIEQVAATRPVPGHTPAPQPKKTTDKPKPKPKKEKPRRDATDMAKHLANQTKHLVEMIEELSDPQISILNLKREQRYNLDTKAIITYLENGQVPNDKNKKETEQFIRIADDHIMLNDILVHINTVLWKKHKEFSFQPVIPEDMRLPILKLFHDVPMAGHAGAQRMLSTMLPKVYWKSMAADVQKFTATCHICLKAKKMNMTNNLPMTAHSTPSYPFQFVHIDAIGPLPKTPGKNLYIQVVVDRFSKFCIAYPTTSLDADTTTAEFIEKVVLAEGIPTYLQSDNGTSYKNSKFRNMTNSLNIKHVFSSSYRPKSNGQAERYVKTLSEGIRIYCMEHQDTWDVYLPHLVFAINNAESATTAFTPFFIMKGRNPNTIVDSKINPQEEKSLNLHIIDKLKRIDYTYNQVIENIEKRTEQMRQQHDKKAKPTQVQKESLVYVKVPRLLDRTKCLKLQHVYSGPYIVCKFISKTSVLLKSVITMKMAPKSVHVDRLKLVRHVRNNNFIHRLIDPNDDLINKLWKKDGNSYKARPALLQTRNIYKAQPAHSKVKRRTPVGLKP